MNIIAQLHLPGGIGAPGFLSLTTTDGTITIRFSARQTTLLVQLLLTRQRQSSWPEPSVGWMTAQLLGEAMGGGPKDYVVSPESIRKYVGRIRNKVRQTLGRAGNSFELFERLPMLGYRLAIEVELFEPAPLESVA